MLYYDADTVFQELYSNCYKFLVTGDLLSIY